MSTRAPGFLEGIPDDLLRRLSNKAKDDRRAQRLLDYCEARGIRPSWADLHEEAARRGFVTPMAVLADEAEAKRVKAERLAAIRAARDAA